MNLQSHLNDLTQKWSTLGKRKTSTDVLLVGNLKSISDDYYHIHLYPHNANTIPLASQLAGIDLPEELIKFYESNNGINAFSGSLSIYGFREDMSRVGDKAFQPLSLENENLLIEKFSSEIKLLIGSFGTDDTLICLLENGSIGRCNQDGTKIFGDWPSFNEMLSNELTKISDSFWNQEFEDMVSLLDFQETLDPPAQ